MEFATCCASSSPLPDHRGQDLLRGTRASRGRVPWPRASQGPHLRHSLTSMEFWAWSSSVSSRSASGLVLAALPKVRVGINGIQTTNQGCHCTRPSEKRGYGQLACHCPPNCDRLPTTLASLHPTTYLNGTASMHPCRRNCIPGDAALFAKVGSVHIIHCHHADSA